MELQNRRLIRWKGILIDLHDNLANRQGRNALQLLHGDRQITVNLIALRLLSKLEAFACGQQQRFIRPGPIEHRINQANLDRLVGQAGGHIDANDIIQEIRNLAGPQDQRQQAQALSLPPQGKLHLMQNPFRRDRCWREQQTNNLGFGNIAGQFLIEQLGRFNVNNIQPDITTVLLQQTKDLKGGSAIGGTVRNENTFRHGGKERRVNRGNQSSAIGSVKTQPIRQAQVEKQP
ncbi:MAG: hypothetical protein VKI42_09735 [Synechococcaceae cyanobacterium]|nr:hypothetical protein [Synechococcaceae cyanobacterium]